MNIEKAVNEVKGRLETVGGQAQDVAKVSFKTLKAANDIVVTGVQGLVETHSEAAMDLFNAGKQSFEKAVADGLLAVVKAPIEYLPEGRETIVDAFNDTITVVTKTGEKLVKVVKHGYSDVVATFNGKPARKARKTVRKTARKVVRKAAATAQAAV